MKKNDICRAVVSGFTSEGLGVCRVDGRAVFVPNAAPGEEYELRITHVGNTAAYGKIEKIITRSPQRIARLCSYAKQCGGCDFWHLTYAAEQKIKAQRVLDALNRIGGQFLTEISLTGAATCEGYRNKAIFPVCGGRRGITAGFYQKARTRSFLWTAAAFSLPAPTAPRMPFSRGRGSSTSAPMMKQRTTGYCAISMSATRRRPDRCLSALSSTATAFRSPRR